MIKKKNILIWGGGLRSFKLYNFFNDIKQFKNKSLQVKYIFDPTTKKLTFKHKCNYSNKKHDLKKFIENSNYFISSSLWEEPGHAIFEAGYLNKLIISSDCPNGPREILINNFNSIKYKSGDHIKLSEIIKSLIEDKIKDQDELRLNMKKLLKNYTMLMFAKKFKQILN